MRKVHVKLSIEEEELKDVKSSIDDMCKVKDYNFFYSR